MFSNSELVQSQLTPLRLQQISLKLRQRVSGITQIVDFKDALLAPIMVIVIIVLTMLPAQQPAQLQSLAVNSTNVSQLINYQRLRHGLQPLQYDLELERAARLKAEDMVQKGYFAHYHDGQTPWDFMLQAGASDWRVAGENLAKNFSSSEQMVTAWMNSPLHRENILSDDYQKTGIAVVRVNLPGGLPISVTVELFTGI